MRKLHHRISLIASTLLAITYFWGAANEAGAAPDTQLGLTENTSIQSYFGSVQAKIRANWKPPKGHITAS